MPMDVYLKLLDRMAMVPLKKDFSCTYLVENLRLTHDGHCSGCTEAKKNKLKKNAEYRRKQRLKNKRR